MLLFFRLRPVGWESRLSSNMYTEQEFLVMVLKRKWQWPCFAIFNRWKNYKILNPKVVRYQLAFGIENCTREKMTRLLMEHGVPHPKSYIMNTHDDVSRLHTRRGNLYAVLGEKGDFHAIHREDVSYVRTREELIGLLSEYALRGIQRAVVNEHLKGDLVKFYGVAGTNFFHWFYPLMKNHSKFGHEAINGHPRAFRLERMSCKIFCNRAMTYWRWWSMEGDYIVSPDGEMRIIDFNDWPSFAPRREEASREIANRVIQMIDEYRDNSKKKPSIESSLKSTGYGRVYRLGVLPSGRLSVGRFCLTECVFRPIR